MGLTLSYFSFRGRAEQIRLLLHFVGASFEDRHVNREQFGQIKQAGVQASYFGSLPVLEDDGFVLSQGPVIMNYLARKFGIAPDDPKLAAKAEAITLGAEDLRTKYFGIAGKNKDEPRAAFLAGDWPKRWLPAFEGLLAQNGDHGVFVGDAPTQADIAVWDVLDAMLTYVPGASLAGHPRVEALHATIASAPTLEEYLAARPE